MTESCDDAFALVWVKFKSLYVSITMTILEVRFHHDSGEVKLSRTMAVSCTTKKSPDRAWDRNWLKKIFAITASHHVTYISTIVRVQQCLVNHTFGLSVVRGIYGTRHSFIGSISNIKLCPSTTIENVHARDETGKCSVRW